MLTPPGGESGGNVLCLLLLVVFVPVALPVFLPVSVPVSLAVSPDWVGSAVLRSPPVEGPSVLLASPVGEAEDWSVAEGTRLADRLVMRVLEEMGLDAPVGPGVVEASARTTRASNSGSQRGHDEAEAKDEMDDRHRATWNRAGAGRMVMVARRGQAGQGRATVHQSPDETCR